MDAYEVCRRLRTTTRTSHIPIIFFTSQETPDSIAPLLLDIDYSLGKPIDFEELKLHVYNALHPYQRPTPIHPISGFVVGRVIEAHLRELMRTKRTDWAYIDIKIASFDSFKEVYSWQAGDKVIWEFALMLVDVIEAYGTNDDFVGHPSGDNFILISHSEKYQEIINELEKRFGEMIPQFYTEEDREITLMSLSFGLVDMRETEVKDIREMVELASEDRRRRLGLPMVDEDDASDILTSW